MQLLRLAMIPRRIVMNALMGTVWYRRLRRWLRARASTGTGDLVGARYAGHVLDNFTTYQRLLRGRLDHFDGLRVLELGPGEHLGVGLLCMAAGAREVLAIDACDELRARTTAITEMYMALAAALPAGLSRERFDQVRVAGAPGPLLRYLPNLPIEAARAERIGHFDLIVSTSVLEHVADLRAGLHAMYDLLNPGGWMAHCVDLGSHDRYERSPLAFLQTPTWVWQLQFGNLGGPNRLRVGNYRRLLADCGFAEVCVSIEQTFPEAEVRRARPLLAPEFVAADDDDLRAAVIFVCARRPPNAP